MTERQRFRGHIVYEPSGRALETARFIAGGVKPIVVANTCKTCSHMCSYCYCPTVLKVPKEKFHVKAELKNRTVQKVDMDLEKIKMREGFDPRTFYMSFISDPYMYGRPDIQDVTNIVLDRVRQFDNRIKIITLTKGFLSSKIHYPPIIPDWYGISLVSMDEKFRREYEPGAAKFNERLAGAREMAENGSKIWVSMEPYPTPNISDRNVQHTLELMDDLSDGKIEKLIFGRWNYDQRTKGQENTDFYIETAKKVVAFCHDNDISVKVKEDILKTVDEDVMGELR